MDFRVIFLAWANEFSLLSCYMKTVITIAGFEVKSKWDDGYQVCSPLPGKESAFQKVVDIITCVRVSQVPAFLPSSDWWGPSPEFKRRKGQQPRASPPGFPLTLRDMYVRRQVDRFSSPLFPAYSAQLLPELSDLRPALCPHVTHGNNLVLFCSLG